MSKGECENIVYHQCSGGWSRSFIGVVRSVITVTRSFGDPPSRQDGRPRPSRAEKGEKRREKKKFRKWLGQRAALSTERVEGGAMLDERSDKERVAQARNVVNWDLVTFRRNWDAMRASRSRKGEGG